MNTLGLILLGSIAHVTGFAAVGMLVYLALRRWGPAAGSLAAGSSLLIMVLVSLIGLGSWPRWWTFDPEGLIAKAPGDLRTEAPPEPSSPAQEGDEVPRRARSSAPRSSPMTTRRTARIRMSSPRRTSACGEERSPRGDAAGESAVRSKRPARRYTRWRAGGDRENQLSPRRSDRIAVGRKRARQDSNLQPSDP